MVSFEHFTHVIRAVSPDEVLQGHDIKGRAL